METSFDTTLTIQKNKRRLWASLLMAILVLATGLVVGSIAYRTYSKPKAAGDVVLSFSPSGETTIQKGQELTLAVLMDTIGAEVTGTVLVIAYPQDVLTVKSVTPSSPLTLLKTPTTDEGKIMMTFGSNCTSTCSKAQGSGILVSIKFEATNGTSGKTISFTNQTVVASLGASGDSLNRSSLAPLNVIVNQ